MKELNKHILEDAIKRLPQHSPKPVVWDALCMKMDQGDAEMQFDEAINEMPVYKAPEMIWDQIEAGLNEEVSVETVVAQPATSKRFTIFRYAAAAAVLLLITAGIYTVFNTQSQFGNGVTISYSTEVAQTVLFQADWEQDNDAFDQILAFCNEQQFTCEQPEFKILKSELLDLNEARESLKEAIDRYGEDSDLILQLTEIENERSDVLKQMIARI